MNKYIKDKSERTYKKLEANILKNVTSSNMSKNVRNYKNKLFTEQPNEFFNY